MGGEPDGPHVELFAAHQGDWATAPPVFHSKMSLRRDALELMGGAGKMMSRDRELHEQDVQVRADCVE